MKNLEKYYNKFNEEHRLETRHGQVEFETSMKYIHEVLDWIATAGAENSRASGIPNRTGGSVAGGDIPNRTGGLGAVKILDVGAGTGRYSVALSKEGYDVTAVELVKRNLEVLRGKHTPVKTWSGDARNLSFLDDDTFDLTIMFGPCYHLQGDDEKLKALLEAKRVTKPNGVIMVAYVMNEYSVLSYCFGKTFGENKISEILEKGGLDESFHIKTNPDELYDYVRLEDIDRLNKKAGLKRIKIFSPDGPSDYMRRELNAMSEEEFAAFKKYVLAVAERQDLIGAGSHVVDILNIRY